MLKLYNANETNFAHNGLGILKDSTNAKVTEEINGMFELEFTYRVDSFLFSELDYDMIIKADASPNFLNQLFRIYYISKVLNGEITVKAQHISYDLFDNFVESVNLENVTCEYALNQIFTSCTESNNFIGHSDIVNAQDYSIECINPYEAIKGTRGSIVDTFGLGAKLKRDNFDIHVLNTRGESNNVLIAYKKNIIGFEASVDTQDIVTKIYPYAMVDTPSETNDANNQVKITLTEKYIESENISNYANQKIVPIDFSSDDVKTESDLRNKANQYFSNKKDLPVYNYKVEFIELSKTENYKDYKILESVNLDDEVIVRLIKFGVNATTKVVKTVYDPIQKKYNSIELGQLVNHFKSDDDKLEKIENDIKGIRDNISSIDTIVNDTKFPDALPSVPVVTANGLFATVQLSWTFENKSYYDYEVYASQIQDFTADTTNYTNRIFKGKASAFLHEVKPNQVWYYKVRASNTHGNYTDFSVETSATTSKSSDATEYFGSLAIKDALIETLSLDRGWIGLLEATYLKVKGYLDVKDGNNDSTLKVDSFGNVDIKATSFSLQGKSINTIANEEANNIVDAQTQLDIFNRLTNNGQTQGIYLQDGKIYINGTYIQANTVSLSNLKSDNDNPIIKLFPQADGSYCSLDATELNEQGKGNAIRLKYNSNNYIYVGEEQVAFFLAGSSDNENKLCSFEGSDNYFKLYSKGGTVQLSSGNFFHDTFDFTRYAGSYTRLMGSKNVDEDFIIVTTRNGRGIKLDRFNGHVEPTMAGNANDNIANLGSASSRWKQLFAGTTTISTSDRNYKQQIQAIEDEVLNAWSEVNYCKFKFNDAVAEKGEDARLHIGLIAQDIEEAFARHGLDAFEYGLLCKDLKEDGTYIYSIRPDECQFLEMALQRRETEKLKQEIELLKNN